MLGEGVNTIVLYLGFQRRGHVFRQREPDPLYGVLSEEPLQRGRGVPGGGASDKVRLPSFIIVSFHTVVLLTQGTVVII